MQVDLDTVPPEDFQGLVRTETPPVIAKDSRLPELVGTPPGVKFSRNSNRNKIKEKPLTSELYQALRYEFNQNDHYMVYDEETIETEYSKHRPDITITASDQGEIYIIEVKTHNSRIGLSTKLDGYLDEIDPDELFVCYVTNDEGRLPRNERDVERQLSNPVAQQAEIIIKGPRSFR